MTPRILLLMIAWLFFLASSLDLAVRTFSTTTLGQACVDFLAREKLKTSACTFADLLACITGHTITTRHDG